MLAILLALSSLPLFADGKMFSEKVNPKIPYQRALILFEDGVETLMVQSQYQIPGNAGAPNIGWVVPVPAVPEIATMNANYADRVFMRLDAPTRPDVEYVCKPFFLCLLTVTAVWIPGAFLLAILGKILPSLRRIPGFSKRRFKAGCYAIPVFIGCFLYVMPRIGHWKGSPGIEVVKSGRVGVYDTAVVRSHSAKDLIGWFKSNSFQFGPGDEKAIQEHIDRGWCFVTAKVNAAADPGNRETVSSQLLAPLILRFPSPKPVYPTALTATGGHPTEILLYLATEGPVKTDPAMTLRFRGQSECSRITFPMMDGLLLWDEDRGAAFCEKLPVNAHHLSKFKATLTPEQMARDLEFEPDPGAGPFRERVYKW